MRTYVTDFDIRSGYITEKYSGYVVDGKPDGSGTLYGRWSTETGQWKGGKKHGVFIEAGSGHHHISFNLVLYSEGSQTDSTSYTNRSTRYGEEPSDYYYQKVKGELSGLSGSDYGACARYYYETKSYLSEQAAISDREIARQEAAAAEARAAKEAEEAAKERDKAALQAKLDDIRGGHGWKHDYRFTDEDERRREEERIEEEIGGYDKSDSGCCIM